jgi:hypothetical protein
MKLAGSTGRETFCESLEDALSKISACALSRIEKNQLVFLHQIVISG